MFSALRSFLAVGTMSLLIGTTAPGALAQDAVQGVSENKVVTIGTWVPRSGPLAGLGSSGMDGSYLVFDEINKSGGINGYTINTVEVDDGYDPSRTVAAVRKLWEQDKAFLIYFPYGTPTTKAASRYVVGNNVPLLFPFGAADIFFDDPANQPSNVYGFYPFYQQLVQAIAKYSAETLKSKKIGVAYTHGEFGEVGQAALREGAKKFGYEVGSEIGYAFNETNFVSIGRKIASEGNDATLIWSIVGGVQIMAAAEQAGYKGDWLISTVQTGRSAEGEFRKVSSLANRIYLTHFQKIANDESPEIKDFVKRIGEKFPDADVNIALMGYTNAKVFVEALDRATKNGAALTWPGFQKGLESIDNADIGASVTLSYAKGNRIGSLNGRIYKWDGDAWTPATDFTPLPER